MRATHSPEVRSATLRGALVVNVSLPEILPCMAGSSGSRRNRLPRGHRAVREQVFLDERTAHAFSEAALGSGNLSLSLYLERLALLVKTERGALPLLTDNITEALKKPA